MFKAKLLEHLKSQTYDRYYQDIECIEFVGYAKSYISWENIQTLVDWKNKTVLDVGCFHGYFSFKAEQAGGEIIGIDKNLDALNTAKMIAKELKSKCLFLKLDANSCVPKSDIIIITNVFHHLPDKDGFLKSLTSGQKMIMEIDKENLTKVEEYCIILINKPSHRPSAYTGDTPNRLVLLVEKK